MCKRLTMWEKAITTHDGSYPDPIDNCPCEHCPNLISCYEDRINKSFEKFESS